MPQSTLLWHDSPVETGSCHFQNFEKRGEGQDLRYLYRLISFNSGFSFSLVSLINNDVRRIGVASAETGFGGLKTQVALELLI